MESNELQLEARRALIRQVLNGLDKHPSQWESATEALKAEPEAKHRRLRSYARINLEDIEVYSLLLNQEFPELIYFFANYKTDTPTPSKFASDHPIVLYRDLFQAVAAALELERDKPKFNGPNFNRPDIFVRWPWPAELASKDPESLIGGRDFPDDTFRLALQYRDLGRWFSLRFRANGYVDPRQPDREYMPPLSQRSKVPVEKYPDLTLLKGSDSEFFTFFDLNDPETTAFAERALALWRRVATKDVAAYDPVVRRIVEVDGWTGKHWRSIGKRALAGALEVPPRYADFVFTPSHGRSEGPALMLGPRPRRKLRTARD